MREIWARALSSHRLCPQLSAVANVALALPGHGEQTARQALEELDLNQPRRLPDRQKRMPTTSRITPMMMKMVPGLAVPLLKMLVN